MDRSAFDRPRSPQPIIPSFHHSTIPSFHPSFHPFPAPKSWHAPSSQYAHGHHSFPSLFKPAAGSFGSSSPSIRQRLRIRTPKTKAETIPTNPASHIETII